MKKRIFSALLAVMMIVLLLPVQAFAAESGIIKGAYVDQNFDSVIDTVMGAKSFSKSGNVPAGMKLSGTWSYKNTYGDYVFKMTLSGKPTQAGDYSFTVSYLKEDGTAVKKVTYNISVGAKAPFDFVHSINVDKWPTKTVYYLGDTVDLTGMKVSAIVYILNEEGTHYEPSEIDVTDLVWVEPAVFTSDEPQNVNVYLKAPGDQHGTIQTFSSEFRVSFNYANPEDITRIEVYQKPSKLTYTVGEKLDTAGMILRLHKGNGSAEEATSGYTVDVTELDTVGTQTVTVKYTKDSKEFTATFTVTVNEKAPETSTSSSSAPESTSSSSAPESTSSAPESSEPETSSQPEVSEPETSSQPEEPVSTPESSSEPEEVQVIGGNTGNNSNNNNEGGIPFWVWIIIALLVILIAAAVALFLIGRKRLED